MDAALIQKIIKHAKPDGAISAGELANLAPLDSMSTEETAQLIAELEHAGVTVDVDQRLTRPARPPCASSVNSGAARLPEEESPLASDPDWPIPRMTNSQSRQQPDSIWRTAIAVSTVLCIVALALLIWYFER